VQDVDIPRALVAVAGALAVAAGAGLTGARPADAARLPRPAAPTDIQPLPLASAGDGARVVPARLAREGPAHYRPMVRRVDGHFRRHGPSVRPHSRSDPDGTVRDTWSYSGNSNAYAGARGSESDDPSYPSSARPSGSAYGY
jgi:hypothetical protein